MREISLSIKPWPLKEPFTITGYTWENANTLVVTITEDGVTGRGEASGVYYLNETAESIFKQAESIKSALENGLSRQDLQQQLPRGGARNAIDCALWDLECKKTGKSIFELTGIKQKEVITVATVGIDSPERMADKAKGLDTPRIKVKLSGEQPLKRIQAVCSARPDAQIVVDANQGWTFEQLVELAPIFKQLGVVMIEQPLPRGGDEELEDYQSPITLCADESCLDTSELEQAARRYQMINIKLDKTGGLTEALALAQQTLDKGLQLMVGNMLGSSLAMAPALVIAQRCELADLDGPLFLTADYDNPLHYQAGRVSGLTSRLWG